MKLPPVYVINLARAKDRRENITKRLTDAGVDYEIVDAVDGGKLDFGKLGGRLRNDLCRKRYQTKMGVGTTGCYLSHYNLWQRIANEKTPLALILEDDAVWDDDFFDCVQSVINCEWRWNVVLFEWAGSKKPTAIRKVLTDFGGRKLVQLKRPGWCTCAYLLDLDGAQKLVKAHYEIINSIDATWRDYWKSGVAFYCVHLPPANQSGEVSIIEQTDGELNYVGGRFDAVNRYVWQKYRHYRRKIHHLLHPPKRK